MIIPWKYTIKEYLPPLPRIVFDSMILPVIEEHSIGDIDFKDIINEIEESETTLISLIVAI